MSELQAALLAIGSGVIVAVYAYGWWQQRKYRQKFGAAFKSAHADALYRENAERVEPDAQAAVHEPELLSEPPVAGTEVLAMEAAVAMPEPEIAPVRTPDETCALLDVRSDFIVELTLAEPSPAAVLGGLWQRKFDFGKPVLVCGLTLNDARWERAIAEGQTLYERFRIAVQLVDRSGAISAAKLADFRDLVLGVAHQIKADAGVADVQQAQQNAVELDAFCAEVDQMVGVNLVVPGERLLSGSRIAEAAALQGMTLEADGAFHMLGSHGHSLFSLINQDSKPFQHHTLAGHATSGLTLLLDVPRVEMPAEQFDRMLEVAHALARELQLNLVDDNRVVLNEAGLARIREQIAGVETKMVENGIAPGIAQARRLFA